MSGYRITKLTRAFAFAKGRLWTSRGRLASFPAEFGEKNRLPAVKRLTRLKNNVLNYVNHEKISVCKPVHTT